MKWTKYSQKRIYGNWHAYKDLGHLKSIIGNGNIYSMCNLCLILNHGYPDSKVHGVNVGPIWGRQDPGWPHEPCYLAKDSYFLGPFEEQGVALVSPSMNK